MMQMPNRATDKTPSYVLKIFSGIHKGAELNISSTCYSVGSSDNCDIILSDAGIAADHMTIRLSDSGLSIEAKEDAVFIEGRKVMEDRAVLEPNRIVTIGEVHLGIAVHGDDWQPADFPSFSIDDQKTAKGDSLVQKYLTQLITGLAACIIAGIGFFLLSGNRSLDINSVEEIRKVFKQMRIEEPQITLQENGILQVIGYTKDKDQKQKLVQKLNKMAFAINQKIYVTELLLESCRQVVSNLELPIKITYRDHGIINLKGVVKEKEELQNVLVKLKQDVAGISLVRNQVCVLSDILPDLNHILIDYGLKDKVEFEMHPTYLIAIGNLDEYNYRIWENAKTAILQKYGKNLLIRDNFHEMDAQLRAPSRISLPITGVTIGKLSYITLEGGKKYFEGGSLENGNTIKSITTERIILLINGKEFYCPL